MVLVINPGSTTTKLGLYRGLEQIAAEAWDHTKEELRQFRHVYDQLSYRLKFVEQFLSAQKPDLELVIGRGGLLHPLAGGVYRINAAMLQDLKNAIYGEHASNLGALLAHDIAHRYGCEAYIADPVVVDEMIPQARVSGIPDIERKSIFHALNQRYAARLAAERLGISYEHSCMIVAHLGGGISVGAHRQGRVIDVNNALDGEGPFSCERSGGLPVGDLVRLALFGSYTYDELQRRITGEGGLFAYWKSRDGRLWEKAVQAGDEEARFLLEAMTYQISKEIASHLAVLEGRVDAIVLTGALARFTLLVQMITSRVSTIAPVIVIPGDGEMQSLAENAYAVLNGSREVKEYE